MEREETWHEGRRADIGKGEGNGNVGRNDRKISQNNVSRELANTVCSQALPGQRHQAGKEDRVTKRRRKGNTAHRYPRSASVFSAGHSDHQAEVYSDHQAEVHRTRSRFGERARPMKMIVCDCRRTCLRERRGGRHR